MRDEDILIRPLKLEALRKEIEQRVQGQKQVEMIFKKTQKNPLFPRLKSLLKGEFS